MSGLASSGHPMTSLLTGSDIETNIRRLERTQAKINAALETFRNVQNLKEANIDSRKFSCSGDESDPIDKDVRDVNNDVKRSTFPQSQAERKESQKESVCDDEGASPSGEGRLSRKSSSLVRRHSFNSVGRREREPTGSLAERIVTSWYQDSSQSSDSGVRTSDLGFCSDSEGGLSPFKNRIRNLLGSFGKGKKKKGKHPQRRQLETSLSLGVEVVRPEISFGHLTELVQGLTSTASVTSEEDGNLRGERKPGSVQLRPHTRITSQDLSNDTFSSLSTTSGFNNTSNRNSLVSEQSMSSGSYENNSNSDVGNGNMAKPSSQDLTPVQLQDRKIFFIAKEIMTSEKAYVDVLRLICISFREFFQNAKMEAKSKTILPDQDFVKLFSNLPELMLLNEELLRDFKGRIENWEYHKKIADVIVKKGPYLKLYTVYIRDFSSMNLHFDDCCQKYSKFNKLVKVG